jgi:transmembrane 9 superfamily protein 3
VCVQEPTAGLLNGNNLAGTPAKVRINQVPRQIPEKRWYLQPWVHIMLGGVLPFGSIFIEMYFIFTSFYKYYYVYGFMLLVYVILIIVTGASSSSPAYCSPQILVCQIG